MLGHLCGTIPTHATGTTLARCSFIGRTLPWLRGAILTFLGLILRRQRQRQRETCGEG